MHWRLPRPATQARRKLMMLATALVAVALPLLLMLLAAGASGRIDWPGQTARQDASVSARLAGVQDTTPATQQDCATWRADRPLVLLVLGQSNAGNHGEPLPGGSPAVRVMNAGACSFSVDPLPGATGRGGSVWSLLPAALAAGRLGRPVLLQILAVDGTTVDDWVRHGSPLRQRLQDTLAANAATGMAPDLILWQQGEADASAGTSPAHYTARLQGLSQQLRNAGVSAPMLLALSTVCRSAPDAALRQVIADLTSRVRGPSLFAAGPDTDRFAPERHDGCHFSVAGRQQAAALWAQVILAHHPAAHTQISKP